MLRLRLNWRQRSRTRGKGGDAKASGSARRREISTINCVKWRRELWRHIKMQKQKQNKWRVKETKRGETSNEKDEWKCRTDHNRIRRRLQDTFRGMTRNECVQYKLNGMRSIDELQNITFHLKWAFSSISDDEKEYKTVFEKLENIKWIKIDRIGKLQVRETESLHAMIPYAITIKYQGEAGDQFHCYSLHSKKIRGHSWIIQIGRTEWMNFRLPPRIWV